MKPIPTKKFIRTLFPLSTVTALHERAQQQDTKRANLIRAYVKLGLELDRDGVSVFIKEGGAVSRVIII